MNDTVKVMRMHLVNKQTFIGIPALVLGIAVAVSLAIYGIVHHVNPVEPIYGGGAQAPFWYLAVMGGQVMLLTFPFSQALSVTRRAFFAGSVLTAGATAFVMGLIVVVGAQLERATGGWWLNGYIFDIPWVSSGHWWATLVFIMGAAWLFFMVGFTFATVYKRAGMAALVLTICALVLALVGLVAVVTFQEWWGQVGRWFAGQTAFTMGLWLLAADAVLAVVGYRVFRKAVP